MTSEQIPLVVGKKEITDGVVLEERKRYIVQLGEEVGVQPRVLHTPASTNVRFEIENFEFEKVMHSTTLTALLKRKIGEAIADSTMLSPESLIVQFSPDSGLGSVQIRSLTVGQAEQIKEKIGANPNTILQNMDKFAKQIPEFANAAADVKGGLHFCSLKVSNSVTMEQATQTEDKLKIGDITKSLEKADCVINGCRQFLAAHDEILGDTKGGQEDDNLTHHVHKRLSEPETFKRIMKSWKKHLKGIDQLVTHVRNDVEAGDKAKSHEIGRLKHQLSRHAAFIDTNDIDELGQPVEDETAGGLEQPHSSSHAVNSSTTTTTTHKFEALEFSEDANELRDIINEAKTGEWGRLKHQVDFLEYAYLSVWLLLLLLLWQWQRILCRVGLPEDCDDRELYESLHDHEFMVSGGIFLAVITGMNEKSKFLYVFTPRLSRPRAFVFLAFLFATPPVWSALGSVPFMETFSLTSGGVDGVNAVLAILVLALLIVLVIWHMYIGFRHNSGGSFLAYAWVRIWIIVFYIIYMVNLASSAEEQGVEFHVHHYILGWIFASFAEFSHPISYILLAIGTGVYVQGIAAYGQDPYIYEKDTRITFEKLGGVSFRSPPMSKELREFFMENCFKA